MNNIVFKSRINFVDKKDFIKTVRGKEIDPENLPAAFADEFFTNKIRTCTGGAIVSPQKEAYGFHIYDGIKTSETVTDRLKIDILLFDNSPQRALVVGSKKHISRPYSQKNFNMIRNCLEKFIDNVTVFEEHVDNFAQTHLHYDLKSDTYTILTQFFRNGQEDCVKTLNDLLENFKKIKIANGDELFINNKKILKEVCPKIFK